MTRVTPKKTLLLQPQLGRPASAPGVPSWSQRGEVAPPLDGAVFGMGEPRAWHACMPVTQELLQPRDADEQH